MTVGAVSGPRFRLRSEEPLVDEPFGARLVGVPPGTPVTIAASCADATGVAFRSQAEFVAGAEGVVDPRRQPALAGTYTGVDPWGLWWSMTSGLPATFEYTVEPLETTLTASIAGSRIAATPLHRGWLRREITPLFVRERGLVGTLFARPGRLHRAVIVVGGSGGGLHWSEPTAALLASRGFTALALAYFGLPGLPESLDAIPLEYVSTAIDWMRQSGHATGGRVALMGASRGAELVLLAASQDPEVAGTVAYAPSAVAWGHLDHETNRLSATWTVGGKPVPSLAVGLHGSLDHLGPTPTMSDLFACALDDHEAAARAAIEVERITGPILLVSGGDDAVWPSERFATMLIERLERRRPRRRHRPLHHHTPAAGHSAGRMLGLPASEGTAYHPVLEQTIALGGSKRANADSCAGWPRVLGFLRDHLPVGPDQDSPR